MSSTTEVSTENKMKKGDKILTPDGYGIVEYFEYYSRLNNDNKRVCVKLIDNKYTWPLSCYWLTELEFYCSEETKRCEKRSDHWRSGGIRNENFD